ncbi:MAG: hypothetical protein KY461_13330 [Actinobacteria bacterium]|nr:hypothetical protein [Actinomycetota bacterium]
MSALLTRPSEDLRGAPEGPGAVGATAGPPARASAWLALAAVVLAFVLAPPTGDGFAGGDFGRVVSGAVEARRGGSWIVVPVGAVVSRGEALRTTDGVAEIEVRGGRLSLSRWAELEVDDDVELARGELLLEADRTYTVRFGAVEGEGRGAWRVSASGLARYAVYDGGVALRQPGVAGDVTIEPYREAAITEGVAASPRPLRYLASDAWDARLLAEAIRIDRLLDATRRGLATRYGYAAQPTAFYGDFARFAELLEHLPELAVVSDGDRHGPPAETLVALLVGELLVGRAGLDPAEAAADIDRLRAAGAAWGIIVREHGLGAGDLDATIERAVRQRGEAVAEGTATPPVAPPVPPPTIEPAPPPPDPTDPTTPPTDPTTPPTDPPDDEPGTLDPVTEPVTDAVDDLGSLLDDVVPGASDVTDTVNDTVDDAADTVDDLLP